MKLNFGNDVGKSVAAAAAAGLMGVACGGSTAEPAGAQSEAAAPATASSGGAAPAGDKACCKGLNECAGKGGCATATNSCAGKNTCKAKGGCNMHCPK
jgi:hypothetical protein